MKKLIIHAGNHKTGSSSIQRFLFKNKEILSKQGIGVFNDCGHSNHWLRPSFENNLKVDIVSGFEQRLGVYREPTVVVSSENFSWLNNLAQLKQYKQKLDKYFDEYQIVFYIRRQDKHIVSHHQQGSKDYRFVEHKFWGSEPQGIPTYQKHFDDYLDYYQRIQKWVDVFGKESICVRLFEPNKLESGDVVTDFLKVAKINIAAESIRDNESNGRLLTLTSHLMIKNSVANEIQEKIKPELDNNDKLLPSRAEAKAFYEHFERSNAKLNKQFKLSGESSLFEENFSSYPELGNSALTSEDALSVLNSVFAGLSKLPITLNDIPDYMADVLRDSALLIEKQDLPKATELMRLAHQLRPEGPRIKQKLDQYLMKR